MTHKTFIIREGGKWAGDDNIMYAIKRFKRLSGKQPTEAAGIDMFEGSLDDLEKITIDSELGGIRWPKEVKRTEIQ